MSEIRDYMRLVEWAESGPKRAWRDLECWNNLHPAVRFKLQEEFPTVEHLTGLLCPDGSRMKASVLDSKDTLNKIISFRYNQDGIGLQQALDFSDMTVHYLHMNINKISDLGIIRRLLRGTLKAYRRLGFHRIETEADQDGGYMWAKFGFLPHYGEMEKIDGCFMNRCATGDDLNAEMEAKCSDVYQLFDVDDPKSIWKVARHEHGEDILTGCQWKGYFDLNDPEQMRQLFNKDRQE